MHANITANMVNVVLNFLLIGGRFGFPALGITGAAIATTAGKRSRLFRFAFQCFYRPKARCVWICTPGGFDLKTLRPLSGLAAAVWPISFA